MRVALIAAALATLPALAAAQAIPPLCRVVQECFGTTCTPHTGNVAMNLRAEGDALVMQDATNTAQSIRLTALPGDGTRSWVGRSPRTRGTMLLSLGTQDRVAISIHNDAEADLTLTMHLDCTAAPPLTK